MEENEMNQTGDIVMCIAGAFVSMIYSANVYDSNDTEGILTHTHTETHARQYKMVCFGCR